MSFRGQLFTPSDDSANWDIEPGNRHLSETPGKKCTQSVQSYTHKARCAPNPGQEGAGLRREPKPQPPRQHAGAGRTPSLTTAAGSLSHSRATNHARDLGKSSHRSGHGKWAWEMGMGNGLTQSPGAGVGSARRGGSGSARITVMMAADTQAWRSRLGETRPVPKQQPPLCPRGTGSRPGGGQRRGSRPAGRSTSRKAALRGVGLMEPGGGTALESGPLQTV